MTGRIAPVRWQPPKATTRASQAAGSRPFELQVLPLPVESSEDVQIDADGSVITAVHDGEIVRISPDGHQITTIAYTGGRGLGVGFHPDGGLVVCDVVHDLRQLNRDYYMCSGVRKRAGVVWFGSLVCSAVGHTTL